MRVKWNEIQKIVEVSLDDNMTHALKVGWIHMDSHYCPYSDGSGGEIIHVMGFPKNHISMHHIGGGYPNLPYEPRKRGMPTLPAMKVVSE